MRNPVWPVFRISILILTFALGQGCVRELSPLTGKTQSYAFSWDQERQIGKESDAQIIQEFGLYEDPAIQAFVQNVGEGVLLKSDLRGPDAPIEYRETPFTFRVLNSPIVNAFALPGGYIYVTRGLLTHLQNEAQLAVVLGHEIGHVAARHSARQALKTQASQIGLIAAAILGSQVLGSPEAAQQVLGLGSGAAQLLLTKYSRDAEREADDLGVKYASLRGYEAAEGASFFQTLSRLSGKDGVRLPSWQSTHPDPGEREATIQKLAAEYTRPGDIRTVGEDTFIPRLEGMPIGADPREGFVENNVFYHPELRFQFPVPSGWQVRNERTVVLLIHPNREALMAFELVPVKTAAEGAQRLAQAQGVQVIRSAATRINGLNAHVVQATAETQQGTVGLVNYFIEHQGRVYSLLGYSPAQNLAAVAPTLQQSMEGFAPLTDPRILQIQPARLTLVKTRQAGPFRSFLPDRLPAGLTPEDLAILNHVQLEENIPAGARLKLPGRGILGADLRR